jgi:DNA-binding transcriptional ArsR family regulator
VGARPRVDARTIAETLGASAPRIYYHLKILLEAGLLVSENDVGRRRARGPEALVYRTSFDDLAAYLAEHGGPKDLEPIMQELAASGVADAIRVAARGEGRARFMHEALTPEELAEVEVCFGRIARILDGARGRRVAADGIGLATVFVGACLAKPSQPALPDTPVGRLD